MGKGVLHSLLCSSASVMITLGELIGSLVIGSWANTALFAIEVMYAWRYFSTYWHDRWLFKATVAVCLAVDSVSVAANCGAAYLYCVAHWGDRSYLENEARLYWPIFLYVITTGVTAVIVELYLLFRYWKAARLWYTTIPLFFTTVAAFVGCAVTTGLLIKYNQYEEREYLVIPVTVWLVASTCADVGIALGLVFQLLGMQRETAFDRTKTAIRRLIRDAVQTGTVTSIFATITLITYLVKQESNVTVGIGFCLGRLYTLTLLYNLLSRKSAATDNRDGTHSGASWTKPAVSVTMTSALSSPGTFVRHSQVIAVDEAKAPNYFATSSPDGGPSALRAPSDVESALETRSLSHQSEYIEERDREADSRSI
ncbi:unnamed protein product [Mycena citricolor]|uniref:DUF6534 domain-containing protein n=1 Tax=Mycena citricolor TaxID=2018698 RepID=A0AAD2HXX8_9AGAR|nr:unnamed protein product [Mycena citricolor]